MTAYIDRIAPEHERTSCDDNNLINAAYALDDHGGYGRCYRCTLLVAASSGRDQESARCTCGVCAECNWAKSHE